jgi:hypothetical protein
MSGPGWVMADSRQPSYFNLYPSKAVLVIFFSGFRQILFAIELQMIIA